TYVPVSCSHCSVSPSLRRAPPLPSTLFSSTTRLPPTSTLFPYTTLFRSDVVAGRIPARGLAQRDIAPALLQHAHQQTAALPDIEIEEHTSELQSRFDLVCRLLLEKKKKKNKHDM